MEFQRKRPSFNIFLNRCLKIEKFYDIIMKIEFKLLLLGFEVYLKSNRQKIPKKILNENNIFII